MEWIVQPKLLISLNTKQNVDEIAIDLNSCLVEVIFQLVRELLQSHCLHLQFFLFDVGILHDDALLPLPFFVLSYITFLCISKSISEVNFSRGLKKKKIER